VGPPHREAIAAQARVTLHAEAELGQKRQGLEQRIGDHGNRTREVEGDREGLSQLVEQGNDPRVQVRWTQARGWEFTD